MSISIIIYQIICVVVGFIYIKSSSGKISNPYGFFRVIEGYKYMPKGVVAKLVAVVMGPLELIVGLMIVFNIMRYEALLIGIVLQLSFVVLMIVHMNQVLPFGCGCFGMHAPEKITWKKTGVNVIYLGSLAVLLISL